MVEGDTNLDPIHLTGPLIIPFKAGFLKFDSYNFQWFAFFGVQMFRSMTKPSSARFLASAASDCAEHLNNPAGHSALEASVLSEVNQGIWSPKELGFPLWVPKGLRKTSSKRVPSRQKNAKRRGEEEKACQQAGETA